MYRYSRHSTRSYAVHVARVVANGFQHVVQCVCFELRNLLRNERNVTAVTDTFEGVRGHVRRISLQQNAIQRYLFHGLTRISGVLECDGTCEAKVHIRKCRDQSLGLLRIVSEAVQMHFVLRGHVVFEDGVRVICCAATVHDERLVELDGFENLQCSSLSVVLGLYREPK